jgi:Fe-S oxidoreductase
MVRGEVVEDGWRSEEVKEALDLCLSCKGCKGDCPVDVDVATYKAEFLSHYYEGRLRPRVAYSMGLIDAWAPLAHRAPSLVNWATHAPGLAALIKKISGIAPEREIPRFADRTFRDWFRDRGPSTVEGPRVLVWPDTFNDSFHPEVGRATVEVLEALGFHPVVPAGRLASGRPLYDFGMLDLARHRLARVLAALDDEIRAGTPVIGMEPSAISVFRDELPNLFPHDNAARRLASQSYMLTEFLDRHAGDADLGSLEGERALVHGHCHHTSVLDFHAETEVLNRIGIHYEVLDSGCCGMAGAFGFDDDTYDVAQAVGERVLLPAIRDSDPRTLVITDGFSCREMIEQNGLRRPLHTAEVLHMALERAGRLTSLATTGDDPASPAVGPGSIVKIAAAAALAFAGHRAVSILRRRE